MVYRILDLIIATSLLIVFSPFFIVIFLILVVEGEPAIFKQQRLGYKKRKFLIFKFRTMPSCTESAPTHLVDVSELNFLSKFLRATKLDELPQLVNVIKGDMSLVGPRPGLVDHHELIEAREMRNVYEVKPGITGLSQIMKIDMSDPNLLAENDAKMVKHFSLVLYLKLILETALPFRLSCKK